jgi:hypothetical protein
MNLDAQLEVLALVRSRVTGQDEDFLTILEEKTNAELISLLNYTASFAALVIDEFQDKLRTLIPASLHEFAGSTEEYLDSSIQETLAQVNAND